MTANDNAWLEAQVGVLGSVLIEPSLAAKVVAETDEGDYTGDCRSIYRAIAELLAAHEPVDAMTVRNRLGPDSEPAIRRMMELTPTAANVSAYIAAAMEQARLLALQRIGADLMASISLDDARELISKASALTVDRRGFTASTMAQMMDDFMTRHGENKQTEFLDWGLPAINDYIQGQVHNPRRLSLGRQKRADGPVGRAYGKDAARRHIFARDRRRDTRKPHSLAHRKDKPWQDYPQ